MKTADVIVVGAGGLGSSLIYRLAREGINVLGMDRFTPPHRQGSSHGESRLFRKAYFENPRYIPLLKRSAFLWQELSEEIGKSLFHPTGLLLIGDKGNDVWEKALTNAERFDIPIEVLDSCEIKGRFPQFTVSNTLRGLFEPGAGFLEVEASIEAHLHLARRCGAQFVFHELVESWEANERGVRVRTDKEDYMAKTLVLVPGAGARKLLKDFGMKLSVRRAVQFWFLGKEQHEEKNGMPCFAFAIGKDFIYGFPNAFGSGLKIANYAPGISLKDPLVQSPDYTQDELLPVTKYVKQFLKDVETAPAAFCPCHYTLTQDENFILDAHPACPNVFVLVGESGHAFKFAPVLGEILANQILGKSQDFDLNFLSYRRSPSLLT